MINKEEKGEGEYVIKLNIINKERGTGNDHSVTGELSEERKEGELRNGACRPQVWLHTYLTQVTNV